ncbi:MAG: hypothetical protein MI810_05970 [Flavobacteriales bacterium]|nr:hypothetical protein [Flavobacteriales bacterium]
MMKSNKGETYKGYHCYGIIHDRQRVLICKRNIVRRKHGNTVINPPIPIKEPGQFTFAGGKLKLTEKKGRYQEQGFDVPTDSQIQIFHAMEEISSELGIRELPNNEVNALQINHSSKEYNAQVVYVFSEVSEDEMDEMIDEAHHAIAENEVRDDEIASVGAVTFDDALGLLTNYAELTPKEFSEWNKYAKKRGWRLKEEVKNGWHILALKYLDQSLNLGVLRNVSKEQLEEMERADLEVIPLPSIRFFVDVRESVKDPIPTLNIENEYQLSRDADLD